MRNLIITLILVINVAFNGVLLAMTGLIPINQALVMVILLTMINVLGYYTTPRKELRPDYVALPLFVSTGLILLNWVAFFLTVVGAQQ